MTSGVSIVIPTWNGLELLKRFLPSAIKAATVYTQQSKAPTEIVIVDDGSDDGTGDWLGTQGFVDCGLVFELNNRSWEERTPFTAANSPESTGEVDCCLPENRVAPTLKLVRNESNRGFGEACNRGFEAASQPLVYLINNDVEVEANSIAPLVENFIDASVFAAHCLVIELRTGEECGTGKLGGFSRGFIRVHRSYVPRRLTGAREEGRGIDATLYSMFASGGSSMFDRKKFIDIGGFDLLFSPYYWEDVELSYRAWKRGYTVLFEPRSVARHQVSSTIGKLDQRAVRTIEQRNRLILHWIHLHEEPMMAAHLVWVVMLAVTSLLTLNFTFVSALIGALKLLPVVLDRRLAEQDKAHRTDQQVFAVFTELQKSSDVFVYDRYDELAKARSSGESLALLADSNQIRRRERPM